MGGTDDGNLQITARRRQDVEERRAAAAEPLPHVDLVRRALFVRGARYGFVTADGHWSGDFETHVFVTRDYGATWTSLSTAALHGHAHVVRQDTVNPALLFLGTESGCSCRLDSGKQWAQLVARACRRSRCATSRSIRARGDLLVATHGRGIGIFDDLAPLRSLTASVLASDAAFCRRVPPSS